ncbi:threonyl-tRNA synthetase [Entomortierella chlamydospora]|uniref:Threonine--tRNA ligase, cytoplasmic n=1 Tax=Entomortierella chlamydospora TaxID=101097 RepID=A0A9P6MZX6_9FUNG|nr:threonyl-tRNA synthetase [Entomortierella chlamydospora]KAG0018571.1 threonyl-tRNA synthetase [Entomortierella chlamydospora]
MAEIENKVEDLSLNAPAQDKAQGKGKEKKPKKTVPEGAFPLEVSPAPEYIAHRIAMFDELKKKADEADAAQPRVPITITMPDGSTREGTSWETSPLDIAKQIAKSLAERVVIAKVDKVLWDLERPLVASCKLELLDFENEEGKAVFWHSSAHVLGEACEKHYGCHLCIGPPIEDGFYYEMSMTDERVVSNSDYTNLETVAKNAIKEKQQFIRLEMKKEELLEMFKHNPFKIQLIQSKIPDGTSTTVYRCGPLIDLCRGPHIPHTGRIKAFAVMKNSASYFLGDAKNASLQRIYGVSFPDTKQMTEHKKFLEEAAKRDHRKIGKEQELFFFHDLSPGSCFFLPHGARIYNALMDFIKAEYHKRGYTEVMSPNMYNVKLWHTSGHWQNYQENMFSFNVEKETFALKPMNCPGHCLMFGIRERSYRELPLRFADFGVLHRNEASGALTGLTRVRRFQQDDAHLFCRLDQLGDEMDATLDFLQHVYGIFGFEFSLALSTRPEKFLGAIADWDTAEKHLTDALNRFGRPWTINPEDGAFYGPKIDILIRDSLRRSHQCATIQLDFQLPERFGLEYRNSGGEASDFSRPLIIHRAMLGSLERMIAILTENCAGRWDFWLSPRQIQVIPVAAALIPYAEKVQKQFHDAGFYVDVDTSDSTLNKKIRNAEIAHYNFIFVVGAEEESSNSVNVRSRDDIDSKAKGQVRPLEEVLPKLKELKEKKLKGSRI